jgi:hypothetical protein
LNRQGAKAPRVRIYPQITQINADESRILPPSAAGSRAAIKFINLRNLRNLRIKNLGFYLGVLAVRLSDSQLTGIG